MRYICACVLVVDILLNESLYTMGTRGAWARDFALALGNSNPNAKIINLISSWTKAEGTEAKFNPLATTLDYGENTLFNHLGPNSGVRNYQTRQQGIEATVITLRGKHIGYSTILRGIQSNDADTALEGMLTPLIPWGTNFGTVAAYYRTKDVTGEPLLSEQGQTDTTNTHTVNKVGDTRIAVGTKTDTSTAIGASGTVTEEDVKRIAKIALGSVIGIVGAFLIIKSFITLDTVKTAASVAKVVV